MKKLIELNPTAKANNLEIEVYYDIGGMNYFTGQPEQRGYYLRVTPVLMGEGWRTVTAFTGVCTLLKAVTRKSNKAYEEACELAEGKEQELIEYVLRKNGLQLREV